MADTQQPTTKASQYVFSPEELAVLRQIGNEKREADGRLQLVLRLISAQQNLKGKYEVDATGTKLIPVEEVLPK